MYMIGSGKNFNDVKGFSNFAYLYKSSIYKYSPLFLEPEDLSEENQKLVYIQVAISMKKVNEIDLSQYLIYARQSKPKYLNYKLKIIFC